MMLLGAGAPREGLDHEMEPQEWDEHPYEKRAERNAVFGLPCSPALCPVRIHGENRHLQARRGGPRQTPYVLGPSPWTCQPPEVWEINSWFMPPGLYYSVRAVHTDKNSLEGGRKGEREGGGGGSP